MPYGARLSDLVLLELLAACNALAEATARTNRIVYTLAEVHILGKRPGDAVLNAYTEQADAVASDLDPLAIR